MDSIRTNMSVSQTSNISSKTVKNSGTFQDMEIPLTESFSHAESIEIIERPSFGRNITMSLTDAMESAGTSIALGAASASISSPVFKSFFGSIAKSLISDEQEMKLGEVIKEQVESEFVLSRDPALNERVNNLGAKIAKNSTRPNLNYEFKVIDDDTINAFACPGGKIYVHRGLMEQFPDDAHLGFILGHEVGHVENRDSIDRLGVQFALGIMQLVLGTTQGKLDDMLGLVTGRLYDSRISQKAEYEADRRGVYHMEKLGFDPRKGSEALLGLDGLNERKPNILERLLSSHPPSKERAKKAKAYAEKLS